ncbi:hypothetical protein PanWU01x14_253300 [Parasponia andersonii]|uniref:Uncharacterized protein n=1 Tax=Parasponia andersonii TaxID=3476 RepID=A0A2P5BBQ1_PARAD|nr:hypothetical protein PanWU01x14_253300 [Parasponia andersonii]
MADCQVKRKANLTSPTNGICEHTLEPSPPHSPSMSEDVGIHDAGTSKAKRTLELLLQHLPMKGLSNVAPSVAEAIEAILAQMS